MKPIRTPRTASTRRGVAAIEFALTLPFMLLVALGIIELSLLQSRMYLLSRAARDGCRIGSGVIEGPGADGSEIKAAALAHAQQVLDNAGVACGSDGCELSADWYEDEGWMMLRVQVGVPYTPFTGLLPMIPTVTTGQFTMLTQQQIFD